MEFCGLRGVLGGLTDNLVRNSTIDDTNDVPQRRGYILLLIEKIYHNVVRCWANVIIDTLIS